MEASSHCCSLLALHFCSALAHLFYMCYYCLSLLPPLNWDFSSLKVTVCSLGEEWREQQESNADNWYSALHAGDIGFKNIKEMKARVFGSINKSANRMEQHTDTTHCHVWWAQLVCVYICKVERCLCFFATLQGKRCYLLMRCCFQSCSNIKILCFHCGDRLHPPMCVSVCSFDLFHSPFHLKNKAAQMLQMWKAVIISPILSIQRQLTGQWDSWYSAMWVSP
jgi:hypothetical protein